MENRKEATWLKDQSEIKNATFSSLKRSLLTSDGHGEKFKEKVLE